ncbi:hypothetical protein DSECCO2_237550 [anaerobic digester metagenome]
MYHNEKLSYKGNCADYSRYIQNGGKFHLNYFHKIRRGMMEFIIKIIATLFIVLSITKIWLKVAEHIGEEFKISFCIFKLWKKIKGLSFK